MKKLAIFTTLIFFVIALGITGETQKTEKKNSKNVKKTDKNEIQWMRYDEGVKLAKEKNLHVFVNFTTAWCGWCKRMNKTTFLVPEIVKLLNEEFVPIKVDAESKLELNVDGYKITESKLALNEFGARSYPTYWFLKSDTEKLGKLGGFQQADNFEEILFFIKESLYDKMTFDEYLKAGGKKSHSKS